MAFFNKLNDLAKNIGDKTTDAIETTKLNSKANSERTAAGEELKKIGEFYYEKYKAGEEAAPEIVEFCQNADAHYAAEAAARAEIERIKTENEAPKATPAAAPEAPAADGLTCAACGAANAPGTKFCSQCGGQLSAPEPQARFCSNCGAAVADGIKFCGSCGAKL